MMRYRTLSKLRSYLLTASAAIVLAVGPVACSSSGDESPNPSLENAASGEEAQTGNGENSGNAPLNNAEAAANGNAESGNAAQSEGGEAAASDNPIGNELNNAIANNEQGAAPAEGNAVAPANDAAGGALNAEVNTVGTNTAGASGMGESGDAVAGAADANAGNPFATQSNAMPANAAPTDTNAAAAAPMDNSSAPPAAYTETAPADATAATGSAPAPASMESSAAGPTALPEMGSKMAYYVMRGDTLGSIAQKIYGAKNKWKALQSENGLADANKIYPGDVIYFTLDESSKAFAEKYELGNRQSYTVAKGDTLSRIAAKFLGGQGSWRVLWKENPQVQNPDRIRVGMVLTYRTASKVALKDENEDEVSEDGDEAIADEDNEALPQGLVQTDLGFEQLTAAVE